MKLNLAFDMRSCAAALILLSIAGCATTHVVDEWKDPHYTGGPLKKIAIFIAVKDAGERRALEDRAASYLTGPTKGVASYTLFPDRAQLNQANAPAIRDRLSQEGIDGALVVRLQSIKTDTVYVPPQYSTFYGYSAYAYGYGYVSPGYAYQESKYIVESRVYTLPQGNMIWSATSVTTNPDSRGQLVKDVGKVLQTKLVNDGIIATGHRED